MHARREDPAIPAWSSDQLDALTPPEVEAPYFDQALNAWILSKHSDILAAFHTSSLCPVGSNSKKIPEQAEETLRTKMRTETRAALYPGQLKAWREQWAPEIEELVRTLPTDKPIDLLAAYAEPLCLSLAAMVTAISQKVASSLSELARIVSASAAEPYDEELRIAAKKANEELRCPFNSVHEALRDSSFVALSQTVPRMLGNAWFGLLRYPQQWSLLHTTPELTEQAVEELMRYAGLVRIIARYATEDIKLNGLSISKGERIIMRIFAGNRDPKCFANPDQVDVLRRSAGSLGLGAGSHSCVGASLIRMAAVMLTRPLMQSFSSANLTRPVEWKGGSVCRSPRFLWVNLHPTVYPITRQNSDPPLDQGDELGI
jgi:cytochrome P450